MTLAPSSAPPPAYPHSNPKGRSHGCLWGCLILVLILVIPPMLIGGYGAWFLWDGYRRDPVLRVVGEMVRRDGMAQQVLGSGAVVTGVEGNFFSWVPGQTSHDYVVTLEGPKGDGRLAVTTHQSGFDNPKLDSAILTGPDGRRYDLLKHQALPSDQTSRPDTSI